MTGSWKGRGNQYIQLVKVLYYKLQTKGKQLSAFSLKARPGFKLWSLRWKESVLPLCYNGPLMGYKIDWFINIASGTLFQLYYDGTAIEGIIIIFTMYLPKPDPELRWSLIQNTINKTLPMHNSPAGPTRHYGSTQAFSLNRIMNLQNSYIFHKINHTRHKTPYSWRHQVLTKPSAA